MEVNKRRARIQSKIKFTPSSFHFLLPPLLILSLIHLLRLLRPPLYSVYLSLDLSNPSLTSSRYKQLDKSPTVNIPPLPRPYFPLVANFTLARDYFPPRRREKIQENNWILMEKETSS